MRSPARTGTGSRVPEVAPLPARRRNILFITTDQQRHDSLGCNGGTVARTPVVDRAGRRGHQLPARLQPEHGVHAGAVDDADRPVRAHARRGGQRHPPPGRCALGGAVPARHGRLPHRPARQGALRARLRPDEPVRGERAGGPRGHRALARLRAVGAGHARRRLGRPPDRALRPLAQGASPRAPAQLRRPAPGRARRRHRGAGDQEQPDPARVVPHRLGGRPHGRLAELARRGRAVVLLDVVPRPAPSVGPAGLRAVPGALAGPRPAARPPRLRRGRPRRPGPQAPALARLLGRPVLQHGGRSGLLRPVDVDRTTRYARSTPRCT